MAGDVSHLGERGRHIWNWPRRNDCNPELYFEPETTEEIRQIVNSARMKGRKVRVIGAGHSFSDQAMVEGYMICLRKYNKLLHVNKTTHQIKVEAGVTMQDLNDNILPKHGMAISIQGTEPSVTIGGAVTTGTHGTGGNYGLMADYIVAMELMTSTGDVIEISQESNKELLPAAKLSIGALGIILTLTYQCEPAYNLHQRNYTCDLKDVLEHTQVHVHASDHFQFMWVPYTDKAICSHSTRTEQEPKPQRVSYFRSVFVGVINCLYLRLLWLCTLIPAILPRLNGLYYALVCSPRWEAVVRSDKGLTLPTFPNHDSLEFAVPKEEVTVVLLQLKSLLESSISLAHLIIVRFARKDDTLISPAFGHDVALISMILYRPHGKFLPPEASFRGAFEDVLSSASGRPHWGKIFDRPRYDFPLLYPEWNAFCAIRDKLDPSRMFINDFLGEIF